MDPVRAVVGSIRSYEAAANAAYDRLVFHKPESPYNAKAPDYWISWALAAAFTIVACVQYLRRVRDYRHHVQRKSLPVAVRTLISAYIDNDNPWFVISKFAAQSLWFLGGIQLDYGKAFAVMMVFFGVESVLDSVRVLVAYFESPSLEAYVPTSDFFIKPKDYRDIEVKPTNVYEDLSRPYMIILMVFLTQLLLISLVVIDIFHAPTYTCFDGTTGCPVAGTLGSYSFYVFGVFLTLVYMLGPKTNYGCSEQNMSYWLVLLLTAKRGARVGWTVPTTGQEKHLDLVRDDARLWLRFALSFLVNGVGFQVLIHALPIQVASQSSFTLVVLRSVGMMHLADLDDTSGGPLRLSSGPAARPAGDTDPAGPDGAHDDAVDGAATTKSAPTLAKRKKKRQAA